jgi:hypothetical protein
MFLTICLRFIVLFGSTAWAKKKRAGKRKIKKKKVISKKLKIRMRKNTNKRKLTLMVYHLKN